MVYLYWIRALGYFSKRRVDLRVMGGFRAVAWEMADMVKVVLSEIYESRCGEKFSNVFTFDIKMNYASKSFKMKIVI